MSRVKKDDRAHGVSRWLCAGLVAAALVIGVAVGWGLGRRGGAVRAVELPRARAEGGSGTWSVATYNTRNFFDGYINPYRGDVGKHPKSVRDQEALAEAIVRLDADVVVLQEVEWGGVLEKFAKERLGGCRYAYVVDEPTTDPRGISIGMLSRFPVARIVSHRLADLEEDGSGEPRHFARDLLRADILVRPGYMVSVYGVHLKSKLDGPEDPGSARRRLSEARKVREIMMAEVRNEHLTGYVLAGDCNDGADSETVAALRGAGDSGEALVDALGRLGAAERISFINAQYQEGIDQILLSGALAGRLATGSGEVLRGGVFEKASDHRPVRAVLTVP